MRGVPGDKGVGNAHRSSNSRTPGRSHNHATALEEFPKADHKQRIQQTQEKHNLHQYIITPELTNQYQPDARSAQPAPGNPASAPPNRSNNQNLNSSRTKFNANNLRTSKDEASSPGRFPFLSPGYEQANIDGSFSSNKKTQKLKFNLNLEEMKSRDYDLGSQREANGEITTDSNRINPLIHAQMNNTITVGRGGGRRADRETNANQ